MFYVHLFVELCVYAVCVCVCVCLVILPLPTYLLPPYCIEREVKNLRPHQRLTDTVTRYLTQIPGLFPL